MIKVRLAIGGGKAFDTADTYGLVYVSSDSRFEAPLKEFEKTSYPEMAGEISSYKTVRDAFDYKVEWFVKANGSLKNANEVIANFNKQLYDKDPENDVMVFKRVDFYNDYKKVHIVGRPTLISEATEFWRDANGKQHDVVKVEWTIRVTSPGLCDFNLQ